MIGSGFAWGKLFVATTELACTDAPLVERVAKAYRHLAVLNSSNLDPASFQRLKRLREQFAKAQATSDEDDSTVTLTPLSQKQAVHIAKEIVSMHDEAAKLLGCEITATSKVSC